MSKHTTGPWVIGRSGHGRPYQIETAGGLCITKWGGISRPASAEGEANARLIAAAPELLDSAQLALSIAESWIRDQLEGTGDLESAMQSLDPVRAAIAKALGEE